MRNVIKEEVASQIVGTTRYWVCVPTKFLRPCFVDEAIIAVIEQSFADTCSSLTATHESIAVKPDHVVFQVTLPVNIDVHLFVLTFKRFVRERLFGSNASVAVPPEISKLPTLWSRTYHVSSLGEIPTAEEQAAYFTQVKRRQSDDGVG